MPRVSVPLDPEAPDVVLDLQSVFDRNYDSGRYLEQLDYNRDPEPPLEAEDHDWADALLREKGYRS